MVPSVYNLPIPAGDCMLFSSKVAQLKFFRAKTQPDRAELHPLFGV